MAIVVLVLWLFTAGAGFSLLVSSNLGRSRPAAPPATANAPVAAQAPPVAAKAPPAASGTAPAPAAVPTSVPAASAATTASSAATTASSAATMASSAGTTASSAAMPAASPAPVAHAPAASKRELRRAARTRFDPPSLTASRQAPMVPGLRLLLEFAHPALAITGLAFWLGFTLVHNRALGWIAFGLVTATVCLGLTWFAANTRAARRRDLDEPAPSFGIRLVVLHGGGAAVTLALAALTALVLGR
jgi:hypothetical protein